MEYILQGTRCSLEISKIQFFESDKNFPSNTLCWLSVISGDFSGATQFDIDISQFALFASKLKNMYETLKGSALLKETYEPSFVLIEAKTGGHFEISGSINLSYPHHLLEFEFDVDQTMIKDFSKKLYNDYARFAK